MKLCKCQRLISPKLPFPNPLARKMRKCLHFEKETHKTTRELKRKTIVILFISTQKKKARPAQVPSKLYKKYLFFPTSHIIRLIFIYYGT
jgi:hypothetical protein